MYAQLFLDKYKNINYLELDEISRDFLNLYIKELFDDNNKNAYNSRNVKVVEAWKANYNGEIDNFAKRIMIKFENYPYQGTYDGAKYSYLVLKKENSTYEIDTEYYSNSIESNPNMNLTKNRGSIVCEKINVDDLNNLINEYDEFINFLLDYRNLFKNKRK